MSNWMMCWVMSNCYILARVMTVLGFSDNISWVRAKSSEHQMEMLHLIPGFRRLLLESVDLMEPTQQALFAALLFVTALLLY